MSIDPKKVIHNIIFAYFLAGMFELAAVSMAFSWVPVACFTCFALMLYFTGAWSLHQQYKKYKIRIFRFMEFVGYGLGLFCLIVSIMICLP